MLRALVGAVFVLLPVASLSAGESTQLQVSTPRGNKIDVDLHVPNAEGRRPALVIGPGQGYHKELPLVKRLAEKAAEAGMVVFRFDWGFFTDKSQPSPEFKDEIEDMASVIAMVKKHDRVDPEQIVLAGKSLGTIVGYKVFQQDKSLKACVLLTPVFRTAEEAKDFYPGLEAESRSVLFVHGRDDPVAKPRVVHDILRHAQEQVVNVMLPGNHGLNLGPWDDEAWKDRNARNIDAALVITLQWVRVWLSR